MSKAIITKDDMALLKEASEMFNETGCVPGIDIKSVSCGVSSMRVMRLEKRIRN